MLNSFDYGLLNLGSLVLGLFLFLILYDVRKE